MKIPIFMLASSEYCEYQFYLEKVVGVGAEDTPEIRAGIEKHDVLFEKHLSEREEELVDVATEIEKVMETGTKWKVRELEVQNEDLIGRIDEVQFSPSGILIIDDKPSNRVFNCISFRFGLIVLRSGIIILQICRYQQDNRNLFWKRDFNEHQHRAVLYKIERLRAILDGELIPKPAHPKECLKCHFKRVCKDNLEKESEFFGGGKGEVSN